MNAKEATEQLQKIKHKCLEENDIASVKAIEKAIDVMEKIHKITQSE